VQPDGLGDLLPAGEHRVSEVIAPEIIEDLFAADLAHLAGESSRRFLPLYN